MIFAAIASMATWSLDELVRVVADFFQQSTERVLDGAGGDRMAVGVMENDSVTDERAGPLDR
jgi:hypothetical protein